MAKETERAYFMVRRRDKGLAENLSIPKTIALRVVLKDVEEEDFVKALNLEHSKLRKKYSDCEIEHTYGNLPGFCREFPVAAAIYIENRSVEIRASEVLKGK